MNLDPYRAQRVTEWFAGFAILDQHVKHREYILEEWLSFKVSPICGLISSQKVLKHSFKWILQNRRGYDLTVNCSWCPTVCIIELHCVLEWLQYLFLKTLFLSLPVEGVQLLRAHPLPPVYQDPWRPPSPHHAIRCLGALCHHVGCQGVPHLCQILPLLSPVLLPQCLCALCSLLGEQDMVRPHRRSKGQLWLIIPLMVRIAVSFTKPNL